MIDYDRLSREVVGVADKAVGSARRCDVAGMVLYFVKAFEGADLIKPTLSEKQADPEEAERRERLASYTTDRIMDRLSEALRALESGCNCRISS